LISTVSSYNPNTNELKIAELTIYYTSLVDSTQVVNQTEAELNTTLIERNTILYNDTNGLHEIALNVKKYVKSVYGASAPEYKNDTILQSV